MKYDIVGRNVFLEMNNLASTGLLEQGSKCQDRQGVNQLMFNNKRCAIGFLVTPELVKKHKDNFYKAFYENFGLDPECMAIDYKHKIESFLSLLVIIHDRAEVRQWPRLFNFSERVAKTAHKLDDQSFAYQCSQENIDLYYISGSYKPSMPVYKSNEPPEIKKFDYTLLEFMNSFEKNHEFELEKPNPVAYAF